MNKDALDIIGDTVRDTLGPDRVAEIRATLPGPYEDVPDEIVRIRVVFNGERLDPAKTTTLTRLARGRLETIGSDIFPLFNFVSRTEDEERRAASA